MSALPDDLNRYDPSREPFAEGIDPRVLGRALDPTTGELRGGRDSRTHGAGSDVRRSAWPPPSRGPLPDQLPEDWHVVTALDELDAWAIEHDRATTAFVDVRREYGKAKDAYLLAKAQARRRARASPTERGRRTSADIDHEVDESTSHDGTLGRWLDAEAELDVATTLIFRAKDQMHRLDAHIRAATKLDPRGS